MVTAVAHRAPAASASGPLASVALAVLSIVIVVEVTHLDGVLSPGSSVLPRATFAAAVLTAAAGFRDPVLRGRLNRLTTVACALVMCYPITQWLAVLGSQDSASSLVLARKTLWDCVFLIAVLVLATMVNRPWAIAAAFVAPLAVLCGLCLVNQLVFGGSMTFGGFATVTQAVAIETPRYGGPLQDSNFWGRHLVMAVPVAGALVVRATRCHARAAIWGWAAALVALLAGIYLTQSRGTLIATAVAVAIWVAASGRTARRRAVVCLPAVVAVFLIPGIGNRLIATLADVSVQNPFRVVDPSIVGRMAAQQIAWAMFGDRPIFGFGPGTFRSVGIPQYAGSVRTAVFQYTTGPDAPHNLYVQLAAETGIVGLAGWLVFVGGFAVLLALRLGQLAMTSHRDSRSLAAAVLAALLGWSVASLFLHLAFFATFAIMLAFAGSLAATAPGGRLGTPLPLRRLWRITLAALAGIGVATTVAVMSSTTVHSASQRFTLLPTEQMKENLSYSFGIRTAEVMLPTYAALLAPGIPNGSASADTVRGLITIDAPADDEATARGRLGEAIARARARMADPRIGSAYSLIDVGGVHLSTGYRRSPLWTAVAVGLGLFCTAGVRLWLSRLGAVSNAAVPVRGPAP